MDWQNQHSKNGYTTKSNLHVQHNSHANPNDIHHRVLKIYPKVHLETQKTEDNTQQKEYCWRYHNTKLQVILQSNSSKNSMIQAKSRYEDQWDRIDVPDMNLSSYAHLIFNKDAKNIQWSLFNKSCWEKWLFACRKLKQNPCLSPCTSIS
jgi:hypothetical protein